MHLVLSLLAAVLVSTPPPCARHLPQPPAGLPAPIVVTTSCAQFTIGRDGSVVAAALPPLPSAPEATDGHAVLLQRGRIVWRSARRFRLYDVVLRPGPQAIALGYHGRLYVARGRGPERLAGRGVPLGWTRRGTVLALRFRGRRTDVEVHDVAGRRLRVLARSVGAYVLDAATGTLLYVDRRGTLVRSDGRFRTRLLTMRAAGFGRRAWAEPLQGGLIALRGANRLAVLRRDGTLVGRVRFGGRGIALGPSVAGRGGVALSVTHGYRGYRTIGLEDVQVMRPDGSVARVLRRRLRFALCARGADLSWRGRWLLYRSTEGALAAIDTRTGRTVDLTRFAARLPGYVVGADGAADLRARWAGPPGPSPV
jgi:hypothetical protein